MINKKFSFRNARSDNNCQINCPFHGTINTFDLADEDKKIKGVGCRDCYIDLPKIEIIYPINGNL